jgi:hypothetical protein
MVSYRVGFMPRFLFRRSSAHVDMTFHTLLPDVFTGMSRFASPHMMLLPTMRLPPDIASSRSMQLAASRDVLSCLIFSVRRLHIAHAAESVLHHILLPAATGLPPMPFWREFHARRLILP